MKNTKSCEEYVLGLYGAMLSDIADMYPSLRTDCDRDYKRLLSAVKRSGLRFIVEVLPAFGKHLDMCLANGRLIKTGLAHFGPFRHDVVIPRLFKGLLLRVFDSNGELRINPDVDSIRFLRQLTSFAKRLRIDCPESSVWKQTHEFFSIEREIHSPSLNWDDDTFDIRGLGNLHLGDYLGRVSDAAAGSGILPFPDSGESSVAIDVDYRLLEAAQRVADAVCSQLGAFDALEWRARHGPGAVSDISGNDIYKYHFPNWPDKLDNVFPMDQFGFSNYGSWADFVESDEAHFLFSKNEPPAHLIAVPKAFSGPRLIAKEPTSHQWCQQIMRDYLMSSVERAGLSAAITFDSQANNQNAARDASHTGSHATIDLSNASDRISCRLIERMFRRVPSTLLGFHACRSRWIKQDLDREFPAYTRLRKFSTMGSALTFPVQTYVFAMLAIATVLHCRSEAVSNKSIRRASQEVRVFGDDIIVPIDVYGTYVDLLHLLGLKVNPAKTFSTGKFRESCGYDAYDGNNVTRISVMEVPSVSKPESILSSVDVHNNLFDKGYFRTAAFVRKTVEALGRYQFPGVGLDSGAIGWHSFDAPELGRLKTRFNSFTFVRQVRILLPKGSGGRTPVDSNASLLQYFTEVFGPPVQNIERIGRLPMRRPLRLGWTWVPVSRLVSY